MKTIGGSLYIDPRFLISTLDGGEWSVSRPSRFTPRGKRLRYPLDRGPEPVWTAWRSENSGPYPDSSSDLSVTQPVASRYTDCALTETYMYIYARYSVVVKALCYKPESRGFDTR
jgi:hypothetical protein